MRVSYLLKTDGLMADLGPELTVSRPSTRHTAVPFAFKISERERQGCAVKLIALLLISESFC